MRRIPMRIRNEVAGTKRTEFHDPTGRISFASAVDYVADLPNLPSAAQQMAMRKHTRG
jgi:hypothetical protein